MHGVDEVAVVVMVVVEVVVVVLIVVLTGRGTVLVVYGFVLC